MGMATIITVLFCGCLAVSQCLLVGPAKAGDEYCPPGFQRLLGRHCYRHFTPLSTWTEAWTFCQSINTDLLTISSAEENQAVSHWIHIKQSSDKNVWTAGHSMLGNWSWGQAGSGGWLPLSYVSWAPSQPLHVPNVDPGFFQCLLATDGLWSSQFCSRSHPFVCKFEIDGLVSNNNQP